MACVYFLPKKDAMPFCPAIWAFLPFFAPPLADLPLVLAGANLAAGLAGLSADEIARLGQAVICYGRC